MLKRALFPVFALLLAALVIMLSWQNRQLRQVNEQMAAQLQQTQLDAHGLAIGTRPELLTLRTMQQTHVDIGGARAVPQILYFFSTACRYCLASVHSCSRSRLHAAAPSWWVSACRLMTSLPGTPANTRWRFRSPSTIRAKSPSATAPR